jgi:predicted DNA-binding protein with PD1-like motif
MEPFLARLPKDADLLDAIKQVFVQKGIKKAAFTLIGAVDKAVIGFYNESMTYVNQEIEDRLEIVSCMGNISEKDGDTFVHAHIIISGQDYRCLGGHLMAGTIIFAAELFGMPVPGDVPVRKLDEPTGLALWA